MTAGYPTRDRAESSPVMVPHAPALVAGFREVVWLSPDGEIEALSPDEARDRLDGGETAFVCHARATARRLGLAALPALDLLELFAFVRPARFCVPTPRGLAAALGLVVPRNTAEACVALVTAARTPALWPRPPPAPAGAGGRRCSPPCRRRTRRRCAGRRGCASGSASPNGRTPRRRRRPGTSRLPPRKPAPAWRRCSARMPRRGRSR